MNIETRATSLIQCRLDDLNDDSRTFSGYGSVFNVIDSFGTKFAPGCFSNSLATFQKSGSMPLMFLNHNHFDLPIGKWTSMEEDSHGLRVTGELLPTTEGNDTYIALKAGALDGLSIGVIPQEFEKSKDDKSFIGTFTAVDLFEVSVVTFPANGPSRIDEVRSMIEQGNGMTIRQLEEVLRQHGMSRAAAITVVSQFESKTEIKRQDDERALLAAMDDFIRANR